MSNSISLSRVRANVKNTFGLLNLNGWIEKNTYLKGKKWSFEDHEFQIPILQDPAQTSIIIKPAQVGISEAAYRYAVAACCNIENFTIIYTFPKSSDASDNCRTRIDPMIEGSPEIKRLVNPELNNSEIKQFGKNSFLFFKGTISTTQALSTPANCLIHDEVDKSSQEQISVYVSRLQHEKHKLRKLFSTPTVDKFGVSKEAETAMRMKHLAQCNCCNHWFLPDYFEHVKIPDFNGDKEEITKSNIHKLRWKESFLACPKCGRDPELRHDRMNYVCENPLENHEANAWYVSPFSAHKTISIPYIVQRSTFFTKFSEFKNQTLGLTGEEKNESIQESDIRNNIVKYDLNSSEFHVMGSDMGITCHTTIGRMTSDGTIVIVHKEKIHYTMFEERIRKLSAMHKVITHVMDTQPYTDLVSRVCKHNPHSWGAIFTNSKSTMPFTVQEQAESVTEGKMDLRLLKVNRTVTLDKVLGMIKSNEFKVQSSDLDDEFVTQMLSLKRIQKFTLDNELTYVWEKTDGNDHMHFSLMYLWLAINVRGMARPKGLMKGNLPLVTSFRMR